jgi:uncharacterized protein YdhG (YjbR/CyaY superfamily)
MPVIDDFLSAVPDPQRTSLEHLRQIIKHTAPGAEECISYGMPGFKYNGKYLAGFNTFRDHLSFFPTAEPVEALKNQLTAYKLSRGTIQFSVEQPLPDALVVEAIQIRMAAIDKHP